MVKSGFLSIFIMLQALSVPAFAGKLCFTEAGTNYNIDPLLLRSIGIIESNLKKDAIGKNRNKQGEILSEDYGIMQINQMHVPKLIKRGLIQSKDDLLRDPCLNIKIGTEILYKHFEKCGMNWHCLGTYNAGFSEHNQAKRLVYAKKIHQIYERLHALEVQRYSASVSD